MIKMKSGQIGNFECNPPLTRSGTSLSGPETSVT